MEHKLFLKKDVFGKVGRNCSVNIYTRMYNFIFKGRRQFIV